MSPSYDFDIDDYLNRFIPRPRLHLLPKPISYFLGYRSEPEKQIGSIVGWFWSFIGALGGILLVEAVFHAPVLRHHGSPIVIGSLGASAILKYNTLISPLSQPRNAILGQLFSSLIGVSIAKLFLLSPNFNGIRFVGGALAVAISSVVMGMTRTVHPPAGATALLAVTSDEVMNLGWFLVPLILLGAVLMVAVACVVGNVGGRRYPVYWWTAASLSGELGRSKKGTEDGRDGDVESRAVSEKGDVREIEGGGRDLILIDGRDVSLPPWMSLSEEEVTVLELVREKLERGLEMRGSRASQATFVVGGELGCLGGSKEKVGES